METNLSEQELQKELKVLIEELDRVLAGGVPKIQQAWQKLGMVELFLQSPRCYTRTENGQIIKVLEIGV